ncbi:response regulator transcription factor [Bacillus safensis]|uniref:response regulator n=1 Tax=Bacillus TaxID=1386 RepID=UPI000771D09F|nr:response regulator transcription factor [Bacillus safensis]MBK4214049.1 response regulator transcription factor [Bacillus pumilus]MBU8606144.1 response regulator transcription factor [Bacillus safensis]MBU8617526.1 response regulator transcription factor [Bacillus safensis]MBU8628654.1 response regulator transcription factor [Bacillus safensis]MCY7464847.1 response regulator transcription factor [Bacillus safensis]
MTNPIKIGIIDDQPLIRQGFRYIASAQEDINVIWEASDGQEAVALCSTNTPDVLLMDVQMPGMDGITATEHILKKHPDVKVVILTTFDTEEYVFDGIRAGAVGYLLKDTMPEELIEAIRTAFAGESVFRTAASEHMMARALQQANDTHHTHLLHESFTERERDVLQQMAYGLKNEDIADQLFISKSTVKTHVHRILQKLNAQDRTQAVVFAIRHRLVK